MMPRISRLFTVMGWCLSNRKHPRIEPARSWIYVMENSVNVSSNEHQRFFEATPFGGGQTLDFFAIFSLLVRWHAWVSARKRVRRLWSELRWPKTWKSCWNFASFVTLWDLCKYHRRRCCQTQLQNDNTLCFVSGGFHECLTCSLVGMPNAVQTSISCGAWRDLKSSICKKSEFLCCGSCGFLHVCFVQLGLLKKGGGKLAW